MAEEPRKGSELYTCHTLCIGLGQSLPLTVPYHTVFTIAFKMCQNIVMLSMRSESIEDYFLTQRAGWISDI